MKLVKISLVFAFMLFTLLLAACSKPLPEDKKAYAGHWVNGDSTFNLIIDLSGEVNYERKNGNNSVSINAHIKEFQGDDFIVGLWFMTTAFKVTEAPNEQDGQWQMVVDEVRLTKKQ